jgi:hypothetical protein
MQIFRDVYTKKKWKIRFKSKEDEIMKPKKNSRVNICVGFWKAFWRKISIAGQINAQFDCKNTGCLLRVTFRNPIPRDYATSVRIMKRNFQEFTTWSLLDGRPSYKHELDTSLSNAIHLNTLLEMLIGWFASPGSCNWLSSLRQPR